MYQTKPTDKLDKTRKIRNRYCESKQKVTADTEPETREHDFSKRSADRLNYTVKTIAIHTSFSYV